MGDEEGSWGPGLGELGGGGGAITAMGTEEKGQTWGTC